ncbi:MAG: DUF5667 domain-containing protein [Dehalococcoidales bacterium]|nr:DUF5667 domain-containing protein [Dehalococcoidales bacterium]
MKQSMEFDDILNQCLERILRGETVDQCLSRFPQYADKLKPLLDTGLRVKKATAVQPRPEFRTNARLQFQAALNAPESKPKVSFFYWLKQPQWTAVTAFALLVVLGTATAALANGSMPDQPLYPVKLAMEKIQIALAPSAESRGELYARLLQRRVDEITRMAEKNKPDKIQLVTNRLDSMVLGIASLTVAGVENNASKTAVPAIAPPQATSPMLPTPQLGPDIVPPTSQNQPGFAVTSPPMAGAAGMPIPTENASPPFPADTANVAMAPAAADRSSLSTVAMLNDAAADLARLRDLLASAPESERPVLQNAITAAEKTYEALVNYLASK